MTRWMVLVLAVVAVTAAACEESEGGGNDTPPTNCASGNAWSGGEGSDMKPGQACIACHSAGEGPIFTIAGTVMGASNDDDNCQGPSGYTVEITGKDGKVITLTSNSSGNFSTEQAVAMPYTAKVTSPSGKVSTMGTAQSTGDCNTCHLATGVSGTPGRIFVAN